MSELDELREQYRLLAEPSLPSGVKSRVEEMIAGYRDEALAARDVAGINADPADGNDHQVGFGNRSAAGATQSFQGSRWFSRIPLTRRNITSIAAGFVALVAACSVVISVVTHHTVLPTTPVTQTAGGQPTISSPSGWPADPSYMPLLICIWTGLGVLFVASTWTTVFAFRKKHSWVLGVIAGFVALACAAEGVDQWQGGPLGRTYPYLGGMPNAGTPLQMGQYDLSLGGLFVNYTALPFEILSLHPIDHPTGLRLQAGVLVSHDSTDIGDGGSFSPVAPGSNAYWLSTRDKGPFIRIPQDLSRFPVMVPPKGSWKSQPVYPTLLVTRTGPGPQVIHGVFVVYRWGPMLYLAKWNGAYGVNEYFTGKLPNLR